MAKPQKIISRVLETKPIAWRSIQFLTPLDYKQITPADYQKLRASLIENHFIEPLIVWLQVNTGTVFCLNGRYRIDCLTELAIEGFKLPLEVPAAFIRCNNRKEAAHLSLLYSSTYARYDMHGLFDFIESFELEYEKISMDICLPSIDWDRFVGHRLKNFSSDNIELDIDQFTDEMTLSLIFSKETYIQVQSRLARLRETYSVDTNEEALLKLLYEKIPV